MSKILKVQDGDDAVVATPQVIRFDLPDTDRLRDELADLCAGAADKPLLLDLSVVEFVPSATLGVLVELANRCRERKRPLALIKLKPKVHELFRVCSLDTVVPMHADEGEALAAFGKSA